MSMLVLWPQTSLTRLSQRFVAKDVRARLPEFPGDSDALRVGVAGELGIRCEAST